MALCQTKSKVQGWYACCSLTILDQVFNLVYSSWGIKNRSHFPHGCSLPLQAHAQVLDVRVCVSRILRIYCCFGVLHALLFTVRRVRRSAINWFMCLLRVFIVFQVHLYFFDSVLLLFYFHSTTPVLGWQLIFVEASPGFSVSALLLSHKCGG